MLNKPTPQVLSALSSLEGNTDFETVREWLMESLHSLYVDGSQARDEYLVRWHQGATQVLSDFLEKSSKAAEVIRKSR
jgi:hypothetical protein